MKKPEKNITFTQAVEYAKKYLTASKQSSTHSPSAPTDDRHMQNMVLQSVGVHRIQTDPDVIVKESRRNPDAFDGLRFGVAALLSVGKQLPPIVHQWLIEYLLGKREEPIKRTGRHKKLSNEGIVIDLVQRLVMKGLTASRNDDVPDGESKESACDAVARAMSELGLTPASYRGIYDIWRKRKRHEADIDELLSKFDIGQPGKN